MPRADRFGTISEQVRHSHSWRSPSQANDAWIKTRCKDCAEYFLIHDRGRHYCGRMGCVSAARATCNHWTDGLAAFQAKRAGS